MVSIPGAFEMVNVSAVSTTKFGVVRVNVANACSWAWMRTPPPFGSDDHLNDAGYRVIANVVFAVLPTSW
jgi:hypothetical protein